MVIIAVDSHARPGNKRSTTYVCNDVSRNPSVTQGQNMLATVHSCRMCMSEVASHSDMHKESVFPEEATHHVTM